MTSGMAHVSGGVMAAYIAFGIEASHILTAVIMTAPGAILMSKILVPETEKPETLGTVSSAENSTDANVLDAASRGTRDGLHLALNIAAMLISFLGLVALNMGLHYRGHVTHSRLDDPEHASGHRRLGDGPRGLHAGRPVGRLQGRRQAAGHAHRLNELIAFKDLGELKDAGISDRSLGRDRQLRALRLRQHQLDRHPAGRDRRPRARAPARPGPARRASPARGDPGQLPLGLHRGNPLMTTHADLATRRPAHPSRRGRRCDPRRALPTPPRSPSCSAPA